ncbi:MAG: hypothetical protein GY732_07450 [Gammaproteobacteria bacterium]|nr:hypothetical protein [Gammaproteobacteria bacterium]
MRTAFGVFLAVLLLAACSEELSIDQQIIATLRNMEYAAEEGEHFEFISYLSDSFRAQQGTMDRREFHRFMIFQINQNRRLQAQFFPIYVKETGENTASAHFRILVTGGGGLLPDRGQLFDVETHWLRDGSDWKLDKADWKTVRLPDPPKPGN